MLRLADGDLLHDAAGNEYEVLGAVQDAHMRHAQHPMEYRVRRQDGVERVVQRQTIVAMYREGTLR